MSAPRLPVSDLAFTGHYAIQGNYNGFQVWDVADPAHPALAASVVCPTEQGDVSVFHNLLFGVALIFLLQWIFLGDLRSAVIVSAIHPPKKGVR